MTQAATIHAAPATQAGTRVAAMVALLLGTLFIGVSGFSHVSAVHNAAHDARHSAGFPCH